MLPRGTDRVSPATAGWVPNDLETPSIRIAFSLRANPSATPTLSQAGASSEAIYQVLTVEDVQRAADLFRPLYDRMAGQDGFVSLEVNPHLAHDTQGTVAEARHLWQALARPNVLIKVPATKEGLPAIRQLIAEGINVNVTLLFSRAVYEQVAERYIAGLERRAAEGGELGRIASVASFFVSRIDSAVDPLVPEPLRGKTAIVSQ